MTERPVTLLSGFVGAGKTTLCHHLARTHRSRNGDASLGILTAAPREAPADDAAAVPDPALDGVPFRRFHDDLFAETARLAEAVAVDTLLVELDGTAVPSVVADAFGRAGNGRLRLDTTVTVVDAGRFLSDLYAGVPLWKCGLATAEDDTRSVADVLVDQVEFADVIVLNKVDTVSTAERAKVAAVLHLLNPRARLLETEQGRVPASCVLGTSLFDPEATAEAAGWLQALRGRPLLGVDETGAQAFVYRTRRPFHPGRLYLFLRMSWPGVLRSKGVFWLATHPDTMWVWSQAGRTREYVPGGAWLTVLPREAWPHEHLPDAEVERIWDSEVGDRRTEITFIGVDVDTGALQQGIDWCLMNADEMAKGPEHWQDDPFMASVFV